MIKKIGQAVLFGLFCAALIIYVAPWVNGTASPSFLNKNNDIASYHHAVEIASPSVVNVYNRTLEEGELAVNSLGSGVIMSSDGYILTNKHVIQDADEIIVALQSSEFYAARVVGSDELTDLAVLKIDANYLPTIPQNDKRINRVGDVVLAIGNPFNLGQSVAQGIISAKGRNALTESGRQNFIQTDAAINQGNSGGALINTAGELVGINTLSLGRNTQDIAEGLNFAIPITLANDVMQRIIQDGRVIRGYLGVSSELLYSPKQLGLGDKGVLITAVVAGGPAEKAGLDAGDLVLKIGEVEAENPQQMMDLLTNLRPNTRTIVTVDREGQILNLPVIIGEYPATSPQVSAE